MIGGREQREIRIVDHDPAWVSRFEELRSRVEDALGDRVLRIEHIGSTSVPGLAAKPIIDVLVVVADVQDEDAYVAPMVEAGFELRIREPGHRMLRTPARDAHLHCFEPDDPAIPAYLDLPPASAHRRRRPRAVRRHEAGACHAGVGFHEPLRRGEDRGHRADPRPRPAEDALTSGLCG